MDVLDMNRNAYETSDGKLETLLQTARPTVSLRHGFENAVWRRVRREQQCAPGFVERLACFLLNPRLAAAGLTVVILLSAGMGMLRGIRTGQREARDRYVASVDPSYLHQH